MLELEEEGKLNMTVRLKKRALQGAYDQAIKKKKVSMHGVSIAAICLVVFWRQAILECEADLAVQKLTKGKQAALPVDGAQKCCIQLVFAW